jgi:polysaccharide export outer membrane protein
MIKFCLTGTSAWLLAIGLMTFVVVFSSCGDTRQLTYMQGKFDTARLSQVKPIDPTIQKGDLLSIIVFSDNPQATAIYNQSVIAMNGQSGGGGANSLGNSSGGGTGSSAGLTTQASPLSTGYLVDENGNIQFQGVGLLHVEGLTKTGLKELLNSKLKDFLNNPYYTIRFLNYRFTLLGEVNRPGVFSIPGESINIFEALGLAGDMTFFGRRDNVLIVRQTNGKREYARLDLTKPDIMISPFFSLQQNDIVYIEANRKKVVANDQVTARNVTIAASIVSTLAILYSIFKK